MPPDQTEPPVETAQVGIDVPQSSRAADREVRPTGWITQPPVILQWDEQPRAEDVKQIIKKGRELTLRNGSSSSASSTSASLYQQPTTFQGYQNITSSTITEANNPARERGMVATGRKTNSTDYPYRYSPYFLRQRRS